MYREIERKSSLFSFACEQRYIQGCAIIDKVLLLCWEWRRRHWQKFKSEVYKSTRTRRR